jgi:hypothetical protein
MKLKRALLLISGLLGLLGSSSIAAGDNSRASDWQLQLEAEWLAEARLHTEPASTNTLETADDARGGCDGVTNGGWGFHTSVESNPWWQVDLGEVHGIAQVRIWNRSDDTEAARRAARFEIHLSNDSTSWTRVYQHDGSLFYGYRMPDRGSLNIPLENAKARFVRIQLPGTTCLHLDEVEVISKAGGRRNLALHHAADQSSLSQWSHRKPERRSEGIPVDLPFEWVIDRGRKLAERFHRSGIDTRRFEQIFTEATIQRMQEKNLDRREHYFELRSALRELALLNPAIGFDDVLFVKRVPGSFSHMSDQNYGWWSRPGGGLYLLKNIRSGTPSIECLTDDFSDQPGSFQRPALSPDGSRILFSRCRHYPWLAALKDKLDKANVPEDAFYHVFEMNLNGRSVRRLTGGKYDNFDPQYLPDGRIVFLSTRRGQSLQAGRGSAQKSWTQPDLPDCYVRCGGDASRPVAVYTLHTMAADGSDPIAISPFEMFEWDPIVSRDGTILYSRWDYVDRDNMPYMSLWSIHPDGTHSRLIYGNYTRSPHCAFEPRPIPGSNKILFTASGHHSQTMGSLVLLDPSAGTEGDAPLTRLTPEIPFPEIEGWPQAFFSNPWPLSEKTHLVAWGREEQVREGSQRSVNGLGIYLFDTDGGLELLHRDPEISSMHPIPIKTQKPAPMLASPIDWEAAQEGHFLVADVYRGLHTVRRGDITALRIVAVPAKTQPWMNQPTLGLTRDDPGKAVLGTVPVEPDGSAFFRVPSGVALFFQALDRDGMAVQTMRSATHVQPGQTLSCIGCHENRQNSPPAGSQPLAVRRAPSQITPGPDGSWPLRFDHLVQPVLDNKCVSCHSPNSNDTEAAQFDLSPEHAYESLANHGTPNLRDLVLKAYREGVSSEGEQPARQSAFLSLLTDPKGHHDVHLDRQSLDRLITWLDTYGQRQGHFSPDQERDLENLRELATPLLRERTLAEGRAP